MPSIAPSSEWAVASDEYPLDEDSMKFLMEEAGWRLKREDGYLYMEHVDTRRPNGRMLVPRDEHGNDVLNAFKIYLWFTAGKIPQ